MLQDGVLSRGQLVLRNEQVHHPGLVSGKLRLHQVEGNQVQGIFLAVTE